MARDFQAFLDGVPDTMELFCNGYCVATYPYPAEHGGFQQEYLNNHLSNKQRIPYQQFETGVYALQLSCCYPISEIANPINATTKAKADAS